MVSFEKRLPQPWHRTTFSTSLSSAANTDDKWATTYWIEPNQVKHRREKTRPSALILPHKHLEHHSSNKSHSPQALTAWKGLSERCCGWKFTGMSVLAAASGKVTQRCGQNNHTYSPWLSSLWASRNKHVVMHAFRQAANVFSSNQKIFLKVYHTKKHQIFLCFFLLYCLSYVMQMCFCCWCCLFGLLVKNRKPVEVKTPRWHLFTFGFRKLQQTF